MGGESDEGQYFRRDEIPAWRDEPGGASTLGCSETLNRRPASGRFAKPNNVNSCAVFFARPR